MVAGVGQPLAAEPLERLPYNNPGLTVDLGVGLWAWPLPMDWDSDGDLDLVVSCPDVPYNGIYFFENPGHAEMPVFRPAVRVGDGRRNLRVSYVDGQAVVLAPGQRLVDFLGQRFDETVPLPKAKVPVDDGHIRADQHHLVDLNGDGKYDLVRGIGDWGEYGWDNAYNDRGEWTNGPLHGYVYVAYNQGDNETPDYGESTPLMADGERIDVYGMPSPCFGDFDSDGDLDLICGEFVDSFTYFENTGSSREPTFAAGRLLEHGGQPLRMDLCMIVPTPVDWDGDGDPDLIVGQEDGRVAWLENVQPTAEGMPRFEPPRFFQQQAADVKFGALVTPVSFDWDADGDDDLIAGNTAGYVGYIENLGTAEGKTTPTWAPPVRLEAGGETLRIMAGKNGSIQGPCEAKWGYTTLSVADWDHDGFPDLVVNSIWGKVVWYRNEGTRTSPKLTAERPVRVRWPNDPPKPAWTWWTPEPGTLATQWRTTPFVIDYNDDGLNDLVMLDHEGYLAFFERQQKDGQLTLLPGKRLFVEATSTGQQGESTSPLRLNDRSAGKSGRRKLWWVDWDQDGRRDLLTNSKNASLWRNTTDHGPSWQLIDQGLLAERRLAGHTTSPTTVDFNGDGQPELLIGAEDGFLYYQPR